MFIFICPWIAQCFLPLTCRVQLCRFGYKSLDEVKKTIKRVRDHGIPIDVSYADIDYMDHYKDFTLGDVSAV